jgi:hypothetical protein
MAKDDVEEFEPEVAPVGERDGGVFAVGDDPNVKQLADRLFAAQQSTDVEIKMSLWEALTLYPKASIWSLLLSFAVVMEGTCSRAICKYCNTQKAFSTTC